MALQEGCYKQVIKHDMPMGKSIENTVSNLQKNIVDVGQKRVSYNAKNIYIFRLINSTMISNTFLSDVNQKFR